jgi:hypothetical protein
LKACTVGCRRYCHKLCTGRQPIRDLVTKQRDRGKPEAKARRSVSPRLPLPWAIEESGMRLTVQITVESGEGESEIIEVSCLERASLRPEVVLQLWI